jgi:hypothetical protein
MHDVLINSFKNHGYQKYCFALSDSLDINQEQNVYAMRVGPYTGQQKKGQTSLTTR